MEIRGFKFDRLEFAGSLGDLGVLLPLAVSLIAITGLNATVVLTSVGLLYIATGLYYRLPVPVQPLKVVAAVTIASAVGGHAITPGVMAATGISFGALLLILAWTGLLNKLERLFTRAVIRGIQVGLGLMLILGAVKYIGGARLFISSNAETLWSVGTWHVAPNLLIGVAGAIAALFLLKSARFPAALMLVVMGIALGLLLGGWAGLTIGIGPEQVKPVIPRAADFAVAITVLVIPQFPLSLGNAIIGMADTTCTLFGKGELTRRATTRSFATSMGIVNLAVGFFAGMPMCHGAGGIAAHYRFGARTGGSNLMIGAIFVVLGVVFGRAALTLLAVIPLGVLGALLLYAGLELTGTIKDVSEPKDLFVVFLIAGIAIATTNMGIAFIAGILVELLLRRGTVKI
jgi:SulP family sulfate permease